MLIQERGKIEFFNPTANYDAIGCRTGFHRKCEEASRKLAKKTKGKMATQQNPNEPGKPNAPGQQGSQEQDRERRERERQQRERERQGGQQGGGGQPGGR